VACGDEAVTLPVQSKCLTPRARSRVKAKRYMKIRHLAHPENPRSAALYLPMTPRLDGTAYGGSRRSRLSTPP
jgi:hypothetical protein